MKVDLNYSKENTMDCFVGDIILYDGKPCMVIKDDEILVAKCGILALEGYEAGTILKYYNSLIEIDEDKKSQKMLIKKENVLIIVDGEVEED